MKKIIAIALFTLTLVSCNQTKAEKEMNEKSAQIKGQLDGMAAEYQKKVTDYYEKAKKMSNKARQEAEGALMQQQEALKQRQQQAQAEVQKDMQEIMTEINEDIEDFVKDYAKTNGYTYILGTSDSKLDITDIILEALNDNFKKDKPSEKTDETPKE